MDIKYGKQILIDELQENKSVDLLFCAENHEKRSYTLFDKLIHSNTISKTIVFCYNGEVSNQTKTGISKIKIDTYTEVYRLLDSEFDKIHKDEITIIVDYSCMTKPWYYSIILYLKNRKSKLKKVTVFFNYTPSKFITPKEPKPNKEIGPLPGKYVVPTDKPKALIVCLGYESNKAEGIIDHLDPKVSYLFYTNPAIETQFVDTLKSNNEMILNERPEFVRTFPFNDLIYLERELTSLYYKLKDNYSIIIAPLGPKPFTFISMLMSIKYSEIDIWRVGSGSDINEYDNEPIDDNSFIICEVLFEN